MTSTGKVRPETWIDRRPAEEGGEAIGLQRGRADDDAQVGPPREQALHVAEEEVDVEAALVGLVEDDRVVGAEQRVALDLGQEDAVRHELDVRGRRGAIGEADLVADLAPQLDLQLPGDARGDAGGGDAARLGDADVRREAAAHGEADLGELRGLAGAGLARDDDHRVRVDRRGDVAHARRDRAARRGSGWVSSSRAARGGDARSFARVKPRVTVGRPRVTVSRRRGDLFRAGGRPRVRDGIDEKGAFPGGAERTLVQHFIGKVERAPVGLSRPCL